MSTDSRPTSTFTTPNNHKIVFYTYLTAGDEREVNRIFLRSMRVQRPTGVDAQAVASVARRAEEQMELTGEQLYEAQEVAVRRLLVSVDGCDRDIAFDRLMELQPKDANAVIEEIERTTKQDQEEKKRDTPLPSDLSSRQDDSPTT